MQYIDRQKVLEELEEYGEYSAIYIVKRIPVLQLEDVEPIKQQEERFAAHTAQINLFLEGNDEHTD